MPGSARRRDGDADRPPGSTSRRWRAVLDQAERQGVAVVAEPGDPWQALDGCTDLYGPPATRWVLLARIAGVTVHDGGTLHDTAAWSTAAFNGHVLR
ncbi:MAG: hypothetical protein ACRYG8_23520 [Janthinobacterium lividum]